MAYIHKTQSFMKNGGQQKCLDKALYIVYFFTLLFSFKIHITTTDIKNKIR